MTPKLLGACFLLATTFSVCAAGPDLDHDGIPNRFDRDVDNDGIPNRLDPNIDGGFCRKGPLRGHYIGDHLKNNSRHEHDMDGDGIVNSRDRDMDGDGIRNEDDSDANDDGVDDSLESGDLTKSGVGTLTLSGNNTYTGGTTVSAGTLTLAGSGSSSGVINTNSSVTVGSVTTLLLPHGTITITTPITFEITTAIIANGTTISIPEDWTAHGGVLVYQGTSYTTNADIIAAGLPVTFRPATN
ncbi:MAG: autotransporter-associated beta strand repeat-containing protein [Chthoniobacterales bacterium]